MHLVIWIVTALLVALWSALAYGAGALAGLGAGVSGMPADWYERLGQLPGAAAMDLWLPGWRETVVMAAQSMGTVLGWVGEAAPVILWVAWGFGTAALVSCAALLSGIVALARHAGPRAGAAPSRG